MRLDERNLLLALYSGSTVSEAVARGVVSAPAVYSILGRWAQRRWYDWDTSIEDGRLTSAGRRRASWMLGKVR